MRHVGQKNNPLFGSRIGHQTLHIKIHRWIHVKYLTWQSIPICIDRVSRYKTQLQPAASLVAIPTSRPNIGNKLRSAIITEVITPDVTLVTFTDATISEHFTFGSIELNLKMRYRILLANLSVDHILIALCSLNPLSQ